jgi:hypothetical protein
VFLQTLQVRASGRRRRAREVVEAAEARRLPEAGDLREAYQKLRRGGRDGAGRGRR